MYRSSLTLLTRAMRHDAKSRRAQFLRTLIPVGLLLSLFAAHFQTYYLGAPGLVLFRQICAINAVLITLAGVSYFSSAITEEKEEGTLKLLQMAGMNSLSILVGKSTNRLWSTLLVFLAQIPFAMLCLTLGGLTTRQILAGFLTLAAYLVLLANVALLFSVLFQKSSTASRWTLAVAFIWNFGGTALSFVTGNLAAAGLISPRWSTGLTGFGNHWTDTQSLPARLVMINTTGFNESLLSTHVITSVAVAASAFSIAAFVFETWTRYSDTVEPTRPLQPVARLHNTFLRWRPGRFPLVWKDFQFIMGGVPAVLAKSVAYPAAVGLLYWREKWLFSALQLNFAQAANGLLILILASELLLAASRFLNTELKGGTLPNLLLLPRSTSFLLYTKLLGCLLGCSPAWATLVALQYAMPQHQIHLNDLGEPRIVAGLAGFAVLLHLVALFSITLRWGAIPAAVAVMTVLLGCTGPVVVLSAMSLGSTQSGMEVYLAPAGYYAGAICLGLQLLIGLRVRLAASD